MTTETITFTVPTSSYTEKSMTTPLDDSSHMAYTYGVTSQFATDGTRVTFASTGLPAQINRLRNFLSHAGIHYDFAL